MISPDLSPQTLVVAAGRPEKAPDAPVNVPVVLSSTFHAGGPIAYGRSSNPSWEAFEEVLGALEGGRALSFASGMGAISAVLDLVPLGGVVVVPHHSYSGVAARLRDLEAAGRVTARLVPADDADAIAGALAGAALLWLESPTNPAMEVCDLPAAIAAAKAAAEKVNRVVATLVIPRPASQIEPLIRNAATRGYRPEPAAVETVAEPATDVEQTTEVPAGDQSAPARRTTRKKAAPKIDEAAPLPDAGAEPPAEQASDNQ